MNIKNRISDWYQQYNDEMFAILAFIIAITAFVFMFISWKISIISAIASLAMPRKSTSKMYYYMQKIGRIASCVILVLVFLWLAIQFLEIVNGLYWHERELDLFTQESTLDITRKTKELIDYWYIIPQALYKFVQFIWQN